MDLTQNPKDAAKEVGDKVQNAIPDVGANPFDDIAGKVWNLQSVWSMDTCPLIGRTCMASALLYILWDHHQET